MPGVDLGPIHFGGGTDPSTNQQYVEYYQQMADGTHLIRQSIDPTTKKSVGSATDEGLVAAKTVPTDKPVIKTLTDGSTWAFSFNPDGTVKTSTQIADAGGKPVDPALEAQRDARTQQIDQQLADAEAMAPYNEQKAQATIANLQARTDLTADQKNLIDARVSRIQSQNAVDTSKIGLNNANAGKSGAQTDLYTAEAQAKLQNAFWLAQNQVNALYKTVGTPGGPTQDEADQIAKQIYDRAAREAATGISSSQQATDLINLQGQAVNQANTRANEAGSTYRQALSTGLDLGKSGASAKDIAGFLGGTLGVAPDFQASMGGAPLPAGNFTPDHFQQLLGLVQSGTVPPDANGNVVPNALKILAGQSAGGTSSPAPGTGPQDVTLAGGAGTGPQDVNYPNASGGNGPLGGFLGGLAPGANPSPAGATA